MSKRKNPYDRETPAGTFRITFLRKEHGHYCFVVETGKGDRMDSLMFEAEITEWMMNEAGGRVLYGNVFPHDMPTFDFDGIKTGNTMIAFEKLVDVAMFNRSFVIDGLTPLDLL